MDQNDQDELTTSRVKIDPHIKFDHVVGQSEAIARLRDLAKRIKWPEVYQSWGVSKPKAIALVGPPGVGKAQPLNAIVYTPSGPVKMGDLSVGDFVLTPDGGSGKILDIYPQGELDIYQVDFSDGSSTRCCLEHLWVTQTDLDRKAKRHGTLKTTAQILDSLKYGQDERRNHSIMATAPLSFEKKELPIDPYLLGLLLGDGSFRGLSLTYSSSDPELVEAVKLAVDSFECDVVSIPNSCDFRISKREGRKNNLIQKLKGLNLWGKRSEDKEIPYDYLYSSIEDRLALLRGLMDTDGTVDDRGKNPVFSSSSKILAQQVLWLVQSLGGLGTLTAKKTSHLDSYNVFIKIESVNPFSLKRKADRMKLRTKYKIQRYIDSIVYVGKQEARCIYVESPDHLYITDDAIVTHNTFAIRALANEVDCPLLELKYEDVATHLYDEAIRRLSMFKSQAEAIAKEFGHVLILIDEADVFFRSRFDVNTHNSDEKKTNFFLRWIDGDLEGSDGFTIIASSNAWDIVDPAIRRPGRFVRIDFKALSPEDVLIALQVHMDLAEARTGRTMFDRTDLSILKGILPEVTGADVKEIIDETLLNKANAQLDILLSRDSNDLVEFSSLGIGLVSAADVASVLEKYKKQNKLVKKGVGF